MDQDTIQTVADVIMAGSAVVALGVAAVAAKAGLDQLRQLVVTTKAQTVFNISQFVNQVNALILDNPNEYEDLGTLDYNENQHGRHRYLADAIMEVLQQVYFQGQVYKTLDSSFMDTWKNTTGNFCGKKWVYGYINDPTRAADFIPDFKEYVNAQVMRVLTEDMVRKQFLHPVEENETQEPGETA